MGELKVRMPTHKVLSVIAALLVLIVSFWSTQSSSARIHPLSEGQMTGAPDPLEDSFATMTPGAETGIQPDPRAPLTTVHRRVGPGDTLSTMFSSLGAPMSDLRKIMEADAEYLALATLQPGTEFRLTFDEAGQLTELALEIDAARTIFFTKTDDDTFEYRQTEAETRWVSEVLRGTIEGSFYASALRAGLTENQIASVSQLFKHQVNFRRDLRAGDRFSVIIGQEMVGDESTGKSRLEAPSLYLGSNTHTAFRFDDGNYYDENGKSVLPAFRRWPTTTPYRVSSHFSRNRIHPVTGRKAPHNGVDLATPRGTPILNTGDGIV
ncbi:LysM-like peptidoglycan-binding domain-containing protein [Marinobacter sp.]|uniref:LysM-like peptidoglycan-binding domain-containing protein n=1 Tax=Marinobacter sp. TaxID=50741 RepID=UPI003563B8A9